MKITREWIHAHKTPRGAWNSQQLAALGIPWPPTEGWIDRLAGTEITAQAAERFERAANTQGRSMPQGPEEQKLESLLEIAKAAIAESAAEIAFESEAKLKKPGNFRPHSISSAYRALEIARQKRRIAVHRFSAQKNTPKAG